MPLDKSASKEAFWANVKKLVKEGRDKKQAMAIAAKITREAGGDPSQWLGGGE